MVYVILYIIALAISKGVAATINLKREGLFANDLYDGGYKINKDFYRGLINKHKSEEKIDILDFIPILCTIKSKNNFEDVLKRVENDPAFQANLVNVEEDDHGFMYILYPHVSFPTDRASDLGFLDLMQRYSAILSIFHTTKAVTDTIDFDNNMEDELNINENDSLRQEINSNIDLTSETIEQTELDSDYDALGERNYSEDSVDGDTLRFEEKGKEKKRTL